MPLPQAVCPSCTVPLTFNAPEIGLRQAMTVANFGDGCVATLCGFISPGMLTVASDEQQYTMSSDGAQEAKDALQ